MKKHRNNLGFSLTEMLIATGIMAIGLVMVSTIFPVGVKLTTLTTERTVGSVVADEAFAKVQLYGLRDFQYWPAAQIAFSNNNPLYAPNWANATYDTCADFQFTAIPDDDYNSDGFINMLDVLPAFWPDFLYPSTPLPAGQDHNYHWSALCRRVSNKRVQVTVFVTRKFSSAARFRSWDFNPVAVPPTYSALANSLWPKPVPVNVNRQDSRTLTIDTTGVWGNTALGFFDDGYTIVDDLTGNKYRILEMKDVYPLGSPDGVLDIVVQGDWDGDLTSPPVYPVPTLIWVVPPAVGSDRYPCVGVYQESIYFEEIQ